MRFLIVLGTVMALGANMVEEDSMSPDGVGVKCRANDVVGKFQEYVLDRRRTDNFGRPEGPKFPFVLVVGDEQGIKSISSYAEDHMPGQREYVQSHPFQLYRTYSASKLATTAAIGHAIAVSSRNGSSGVSLSFESKVNKFLDFWPRAATDVRSEVTLKHLLSQTAGINTDFTELQESCSARTTGVVHNLYDCAEHILNTYIGVNATRPGVEFRYDDGNFLIAQAMVLQATGEESWLSFMKKYFGDPLGLKYERWVDATQKCIGDSSLSVSVVPTSPDVFSFTCEELPWGGNDYRFSPISYAQFLTKFTSGEYECSRDIIEEVLWTRNLVGEQEAHAPVYADGNKVELGEHSGFGQGYGLGNWAVDYLPDDASSGTGAEYKKVRHSIGYRGTCPVLAELASGKRFWYLIGAYSDMNLSLDLVVDRGLLDEVRRVVESGEVPLVNVDAASREWNALLPHDCCGVRLKGCEEAVMVHCSQDLGRGQINPHEPPIS
eukprot:gene14839-4405_t